MKRCSSGKYKSKPPGDSALPLPDGQRGQTDRSKCRQGRRERRTLVRCRVGGVVQWHRHYRTLQQVPKMFNPESLSDPATPPRYWPKVHVSTQQLVPKDGSIVRQPKDGSLLDAHRRESR